MAITATQIADLIASYGERELGQLIAKMVRDRSILLKSGLAVQDSEVEKLRVGPRSGVITYINPLSTSNYGVATDDINQIGEVGKLESTSYLAQRHELTSSIGSMDLVKLSTEFNDELLIEELFAEVMAGIDTNISFASLKGVIAAAGASFAKQMEANKSIFDTIVEATSNAAEFSTKFDTIMGSGARVGLLRSAGKDFPYLYARDTGAEFDTWMGYKIVHTEAFGNDLVVARGGLFAYASGESGVEGRISFEKERRAGGGNNSGASIYHNRWASVIHPQGFGFKGTVAHAAPETHLATAGAWEKKVDNALVPFRVIKAAAA